MFLVTGAVYIAINWLVSKLAEYAERRGGRAGRIRRERPTEAAPGSTPSPAVAPLAKDKVTS